MSDAAALSALQVDVARIFFELDASDGFLVAGGAALLASQLITRSTADLDLFASTPITSVTGAAQDLVEELRRRELTVSLVHDAPTFCRMVVRGASEDVLVDLAVDSPPHVAPTITVLGPTLAPLELAGRKLLALFGRAEARDFADVFLLVARFGKDEILHQAALVDPGFSGNVLGQMMGTLGRFADDEIPLDQESTSRARAFFAEWSEALR